MSLQEVKDFHDQCASRAKRRAAKYREQGKEEIARKLDREARTHERLSNAVQLAMETMHVLEHGVTVTEQP